ncbi:MAG: DUF1015 domain-containing protein [Candidatus Omnitrophica bacterium]|nr:DUF1015 domain-containing protein [Candidatus Omnitrophota bacterium]
MTTIKPFKAVIYNQEKIKDLSKVVCPPYDIIPPAKQEYYHDLNSYNLIHVLLSKEAAGKDKYQVADGYFKEWIKNKILIQDKSPAVYFYSHQYNIKGEKKTRYGFISLLRLGDKNSAVFAHEHTRMEPKEDRLRLLKHVKANLSPIFVLFPDKKRVIHYMQQQYSKDKKPFIDITDEEKNNHKLWRIDSPEALAAIQSRMADENIFIADGHHRYEVACAYRDELRNKSSSLSDDEPIDYIMSYFTNVESLGLTILPIHRLIKLDKKLNIEDFLLRLKEHFYVDEVKDKTRFFFLLEKAGRTEHVLGMYKDKKYWLVRLRNVKILDKMISDKPAEYRSLDVSILNYLILNNILGFGLEDKASINYNHEAQDIIDQVDADDSYLGFFLNPTKVKQVISVALTGNKMPPKSTFFYPKVLSGLVINKHEEI